ncbi:MAG: 50S ribosomal protein L9 [Chlamydiota bacterium]|nr:50S ribosomal protein L9 [Chlamydiota bacterium]
MAMKLLLIDDVENLGRSGDIVSVRDGYARNFLLPRRIAMKADKNALRRQAALQEERQKKAVQDKAESEKQAKLLEAIVLEAEVKVDPEGHMYGSVSQQDIVRFLAEQHSMELEKRYIQLKQPIKELGAHRIEIKLKEGVEAFCTLKITAEGVDFDAALEAAKSDVVQELPEEASDSE